MTNRWANLSAGRAIAGHLIKSKNDGSFVFRVFDVDPDTGQKNFIDYDLEFDDLLIQVLDTKAVLYRDGSGRSWIETQAQ